MMLCPSGCCLTEGLALMEGGGHISTNSTVIMKSPRRPQSSDLQWPQPAAWITIILELKLNPNWDHPAQFFSILLTSIHKLKVKSKFQSKSDKYFEITLEESLRLQHDKKFLFHFDSYVHSFHINISAAQHFTCFKISLVVLDGSIHSIDRIDLSLVSDQYHPAEIDISTQVFNISLSVKRTQLLLVILFYLSFFNG